jgi:hypothetical protein
MKMMSTTLLNELRDNRDHLWHEVLTNLNKIVAGMNNLDVRTEHNLRMASFQVFLKVWCNVNNMDSSRLERIVTSQQVKSALENSVLYQMLNVWLLKRDRITHDLMNHRRKVTADELHRDLRAIADAQGALRSFDGQIRNTRSLGHKLKEIAPDLAGVAVMEVVRTKPKGVYQFSLVDPPSWEDELALMEAEHELVG